MKTNFFFPKICITYVENEIGVIVVDPGEEKWTRRGRKKDVLYRFQMLEVEPKRLTKGLSIEIEFFDLREEE